MDPHRDPFAEAAGSTPPASPASALHSEGSASPASDSARVADPFAEPAPRPNEPSSPPTRGSEDALLADAGRIFEQLRIRLAELDHREQTLQDQSREIEERKARFTRWVEQTKQDLVDRETTLVDKEKQVEQQQTDLKVRQAAVAQEESEITAERERLKEEQAAQQRHIEETERSLSELRQTRLQEIERQEHESAEKLARREREFEQQCETREAEIKQQQAQAARRLALQEDHLERLRTTVESRQTELKRETQVARQAMQQRAAVQAQRERHLRHVRGLLDARQQTLLREEKLIRETIAQEQQALQEAKAELLQRQKESSEDLATQREDIQRTTDRLDMQEQQLRLQRQALQTMRDEIQSEHTLNLELRIALEELKIEQAVEQGRTPDLDTLNSVRDRLGEHFVTTREQLERLTAELRQQSETLETRLTAYQEQNRDSRSWLTAAIDRYTEQRKLLELEREQLEQLEEAKASAQYSHVSERREAERVIQRLLDQLEEMTQPSRSQPQERSAEAA